ncbi:SDR family oxidoreductase [Streptomyces griseorubiginosus]|uniref:SDR family oxidoreductase n=1 Tax=Streptomyces griseorubiginosus TaxID=67304 RepID=UPI0033C35B3F
MTDSKVWFVTGAGRGMGVDIARAALAAGNAVVVSGRDADAVADAVGKADGLLVATLDVTRPEQAEATVRAAVDRFGRIDVLVNNAGNSYKGYFEELTTEQVERQIATNLLGPMHVTRAVLPVTRRQRHGHVISISSARLADAFSCSRTRNDRPCGSWPVPTRSPWGSARSPGCRSRSRPHATWRWSSSGEGHGRPDRCAHTARSEVLWAGGHDCVMRPEKWCGAEVRVGVRSVCRPPEN